MKRIAENGVKKMICFHLFTQQKHAAGAGSVKIKELGNLDYCEKTIQNCGH